MQFLPAVRQVERVAAAAQLIIGARPLLNRRVVAVSAAPLQAAANNVRYAPLQADKVGPVAQPVRLGVGVRPVAAGVRVEISAGVLKQIR
jgi:hypothetical protein